MAITLPLLPQADRIASQVGSILEEMLVETKRCCHCGIEQSLNMFNKSRQTRDGMYPVCKTCRTAANRARYERDPEARRAYVRERMRVWREKPENQAKGRANVAAWRENNRERVLAYGHDYWQRPYAARKLKHGYTVRKYGITLLEYEAIYSILALRQHGLCEACGEPPAEGRYLHMDHDHTTGRIRALLCGNCNQALGLLHENLGRIAALYEYAETCHKKAG